VTPDQARAFVGPRADYYLARWDRLSEAGSRALGFNWPAFFLTLIWLLYRRMYRWFWIAAAVLVASVVIEELALAAVGLKEAPFLDLLISIAVATAFGTFGTYWYLLHARRRIERLADSTTVDLEAIAREGGTSWWAPSLAAAIILALVILGAWAEMHARP
jgi:hypothetical protein